MPFPGNRDYATRVVGESHYEKSLRALCGPAGDTMKLRASTALLTLEVDNPYDRNAVRVDIDGLTVGHLSRMDALRFRRQFTAVDGARYLCDAVIVYVRGDAASDYGVRLDLDPLSVRRA